MNKNRERYPFVARDVTVGEASLAPMLPLRLHLGRCEEAVSGLIDTGAAINVIPWTIGERPGGSWDSATPVKITGNLASAEARLLVCDALVGNFGLRRLAFAWSRLNDVPVLPGQVNFLMLFDVCLSRSGRWFEIAEPEDPPVG